jgi:hypothetical protein
LDNQLLISAAQRCCCKELTVTTNGKSAVKNNEVIAKSRKNGLELSSYMPTGFEFAEFFGGGSECRL